MTFLDEIGISMSWSVLLACFFLDVRIIIQAIFTIFCGMVESI